MLKELLISCIILIIIYIAITDDRSPFYGILPLAEGFSLPEQLQLPEQLEFIKDLPIFKETFQGNVNMVPSPVLSYYKSVNEGSGKPPGSIIVGLHYTDWCGYCKEMKPVWQEVKASLSGPEFASVIMFENNEDDNPTQGVSSYPTVIKYQDGKARRYQGRKDFDELRTFILTPNTPTTFGSMIDS